jgi:hypothetical protein
MASLPVALALAAILAAGRGPAPAAAGAAAPGATSAAAQPEKEPAAAIIRRSMAAYGGERARVRLGRVKATGKITSPLHAGEVGSYTRTFSRSSRLRLEIAFPGSSPEVRLLDGARAFRYGEPAPGPAAALLQLQAARLDLPALLLEWEPRVVDLGEVTHEGRTLRVLALEVGAGVRVEAGIDPKGGRILYVRGLARAGPRELDTYTLYRDFRIVDGVLVPFQEEGWANGEPTGRIELAGVEFLDEVPESAFEP